MKTYRKVEKAKAYKEILHKQIENYMEEKEKVIPNSGQLKFFKGLMVRNLAIATTVKINAPYKRVTEFFDERILGSNDEIIELFDVSKNMEAFIHSPYCMGFPYISSYEEEYGMVPYLLIQKIQDVMEQSLNEYIKCKNRGEEDHKKEQSYFEFLLCVSFYEIFIREYYGMVKENCLDTLTDKIKKDDENGLQLAWEEVALCENTEEKYQKMNELLEAANELYQRLCKYTFGAFYVVYFVAHLTNLYAILRLIVLIETVNVNSLHGYAKSKEGQMAAADAEFWKNQVERFLKSGTLFVPAERKRNLGTLYTQLNKIYREKRIYPYISDTKGRMRYAKEAFPALMQLREYLAIIQKATVLKRTETEEKELWEVQRSFAAPIWDAIDAIVDLQEESRQKNKGEIT